MWFKKITQMKKNSGLTTDEIAQKSGVPKGTLNKLFAGQTQNPSLETIRAVVYTLGYTLDELLRDETAIYPTESSTKKATLNESGLNLQQQKTIDLLFSLPEKQREEALRYLEYLVSNKDKE